MKPASPAVVRVRCSFCSLAWETVETRIKDPCLCGAPVVAEMRRTDGRTESEDDE